MVGMPVHIVAYVLFRGRDPLHPRRRRNSHQAADGRDAWVCHARKLVTPIPRLREGWSIGRLPGRQRDASDR